ncbi:MAG: PAS domain S-box protein [Motiliproteus sp.]
MERALRTYSLIFFAYLLCAELAALLTFSSDIGAPVWPAAGVAMAAVLVYGNASVVPIFFAELIHLWLRGDSGLADTDMLLISSGVALQPWFGALLIRRSGGHPGSLSTLRQVLRFMVWGGLVAALIGSGIGTAVLWFSGLLEPHELFFNGLSWWSGDVAGIFLVAPVLMAWLSPALYPWRSQRWLVTCWMGTVYVLVVLLIGSGRYWERDRIDEQFQQQAQGLNQQLQLLLDEQVLLLHAARDFYRASGSLNPAQFRAFALPQLARTPAVRSLAWVPQVNWDQRAPFEQGMQQLGFAGYQITERDERGALQIAAQRSGYSAVACIEPMLINQNIIGYDLASNTEYSAVLGASLQAKRVAASGLRFDPLYGAGQAGVVLALPVFAAVNTMQAGAANDVTGTVSATVEGFMVSELRLQYALTQQLDELLSAGLFYRLSDVSSAIQGRWIGQQRVPADLDATVRDDAKTREAKLQDPLAHPVEKPPAAGLLQATPQDRVANRAALFQHQFTFEFGERNWVMEVSASSEYQQTNRHFSLWLMLLLGLLVSALAVISTSVMVGRDYRFQRRIDKQKQLLNERQQRLQLTQFTMDHISTSVFLVDRSARFVYVNESACALLGYQRDELMEMGVAEFRPGFEQARWDSSWRRLQHESHAEFKTSYQSARTGQFTAKVEANYFDFNSQSFCLVFIRDISSTEARDAELRQLSAAIEQSPISVVITDLTGTIEYVNSSFTRISGYRKDEVIGRLPNLLQSGHTTPDEYASMWRVLTSGGVWFGEFCNKRKDGSLYWESASITPVLDEHGVATHYLAVKEDITASRRARERLSRSEQMLNRAQSLAHIGSWELDFLTGQLNWSDETCRIFGLPEGHSLDYQGYLGFVHPDDQERLDQAWLAALDGDEYDIRHRIVVQGQVKTVQQRAEFEFDSYRRVQRGVGTFHDITLQVQTEVTLQQNERRYRSLFTALSEGVILRDSQGQIEAFNPAASQIMGETLLLLQEHGPSHERARFYRENGEQLPLVEDPSMRTLATGEPCRGVVLGLDRVDGERIWLSVNTEPLCQPGQSKPYAVVISFQDISRSRKAEQALRRLATTDALTGLLNRRASTLAFEQELLLCKRLPAHSSVLLLMDIDYFKRVNDRYGHAVGDLALQHLSSLVEATRREIDMAGRWGGEEFVLMLPGTDLDGGRVYAERLRQQLAQTPLVLPEATLSLTVSVGVAMLAAEDPSFDASLARADRAMYQAKNNGRNSVVIETELATTSDSAEI